MWVVDFRTVFYIGLPTRHVSAFKPRYDSLFKAIKRVTGNAALIRFMTRRDPGA